MKFLGLSNKPEPLETQEGYLKAAVNIDVDNENNVRRRTGHSLHATYGAITGSYTQRNSEDAYIVADGNLIRMSDNSVLADNMGVDPYLFDDFEGNLFVYGDKKLLINGYNSSNLDIPVCPQPKVTVYTGGPQSQGIYQITAAYTDENGKMGGTAAVVTVDAPAVSLLQIDVEQIAGYTVSIYISPPNGQYLYLWKNTTSSANTWADSVTNLVYPLSDDFIGGDPIPDGAETLAYHDTKLYLSKYLPGQDKSIVWFSKGFSFHLFDISSDYFIVEGEVTALIDITDFLVIATTDSIYNYKDGNINQIVHYGIPKGKPYDRNKHGAVFAYTNKGVCKLNPFENLTQTTFSFPISTEVNSTVIEENGYERLINLLNDESSAPNTF